MVSGTQPPEVVRPAGAATRILHRDPGGACARALHARYRRHYIGADMVRAILALRRASRDDPGEAELFGLRRRHFEQAGGFLETISADQVAAWVSSDAYIVAEAADPDQAGRGRFVAVAECVVRLGRDGWVVPQLVPGTDDVTDPELHAAIVADGPGASALIDFLGVLPEWADRKLAGAARYAGMRELIRLNDRLPPERRVYHVVGMGFAVHGVEIHDHAERQELGSVVRLAELGQAEIVNRASIRAITTSKRCPARTVGVWRSAPPVRVSVDGRRYGLQVDWLCHVRSVPDIERRDGDWR